MAVRDKEQDNYEIKQTNNNKKLGYIGQAGILVGLSVFLGLSHHVPTSTNTNKQIEVNRDKENAKENNDKENNLKGIIQVEDDGIEAGDIVGYDQKEDSQQDYNEQSGQDNDKSNSDKQDSDKESNKKEKDTEEYKSNVITAKEILSTITPGTNLKELTKGTFYASSDKEGPVGSFEKHKKEDKMIEIIKVSFENGKYKIIGVDDNINLYQLKKKYPKAEFSCHIKGLGWVNARTVIDAKMKELKKEKNNNKKMVNKGQVVESTNSER